MAVDIAQGPKPIAPQDESAAALPKLFPVLQSEPIEIGLKQGIHARPATMIIKATNYFLSRSDGERAYFIKDGESFDAASIMKVLSLAAGPGSKVRVEISAPEEKARIYLDNLTRILRAAQPEVDILDDKTTAVLGLHPPELVAALRASVVEKFLRPQRQ